MSTITDRLLEEIKALDLEPLYNERVCMWEISKDLEGKFSVSNQEEQVCGAPPCRTIKAIVKFDIDARPHSPCDTGPSGAFDGHFEGEILFAYKQSGSDRGYHCGKFEWYGSASRLVGQMSGVTSAGTHRGCEPCDRRGHMEGRLDAVVIDGEHKDCRVLATYVINFDTTSSGAQDTAVEGALEGVTICPCLDY
jgi:hypothetical protein